MGFRTREVVEEQLTASLAVPTNPPQTAAGRRLVEDFQTDRCDTVLEHLELLGSFPRQIDYPASDKRTPIVYPDLDPSPVTQIGHAHLCIERQGPVRSREFTHVVFLAVCSKPTMVGFTVPRRFADFVVCRTASERHATGVESNHYKEQWNCNVESERGIGRGESAYRPTLKIY